MPMISRLGIMLFSNSSRLCTSNKTSKAIEWANSESDLISARVKTAAIKSMASAPWALASKIWYSSIMNSLRNSGVFTVAFAKSKSSNEPPKY